MEKLVFKLFVVIYAILQVSCTEPSGCNISATTKKKVKRCPKTAEEWEKAARLKNCSAVQQSCVPSYEFKYHCVRNEYLDTLLEVCAKSWRSAGYCVEFNEAGELVQDNYHQDCKDFSKPCPISYISTDVYKYQGCYTLRTLGIPNDHEKKIDTFAIATITTYILVIFSIITLICGLFFCKNRDSRSSKSSIRFLSDERHEHLPSISSSLPLDKERPENQPSPSLSYTSDGERLENQPSPSFNYPSDNNGIVLSTRNAQSSSERQSCESSQMSPLSAKSLLDTKPSTSMLKQPSGNSPPKHDKHRKNFSPTNYHSASVKTSTCSGESSPPMTKTSLDTKPTTSMLTQLSDNSSSNPDKHRMISSPTNSQSASDRSSTYSSDSSQSSTKAFLGYNISKDQKMKFYDRL